MRKIIHIDMDAFYASVEQRDNPSLRNKPIAIGSGSERGVVAAASYEARKFGVHSAMSGKIAKQLCKNLTFVRGNMDKYRSISQQIRNTFYEYTDLVEPLSFDEAYLDVTNNFKNNPSATLIANEIRKRIKQELNLTASAGISYNKFLAKTASDVNKPNGFFVIMPQDAQPFLDNLPINNFFGIGKQTTKRMHQIGVFFGEDLRKLSLNKLNNEFGKVGTYYYYSVRGIDDREVNPNRERKSLGNENTFEKDLNGYEDMKKALLPIIEKLHYRLQKSKLYGRTITLKIKKYNFEVQTKSQTFEIPIYSKEQLWIKTITLLDKIFHKGLSVRLLGVSVSNFINEEETVQLEFDFVF